jgi:hypothetical protein
LGSRHHAARRILSHKSLGLSELDHAKGSRSLPEETLCCSFMAGEVAWDLGKIPNEKNIQETLPKGLRQDPNKIYPANTIYGYLQKILIVLIVVLFPR